MNYVYLFSGLLLALLLIVILIVIFYPQPTSSSALTVEFRRTVQVDVMLVDQCLDYEMMKDHVHWCFGQTTINRVYCTPDFKVFFDRNMLSRFNRFVIIVPSQIIFLKPIPLDELFARDNVPFMSVVKVESEKSKNDMQNNDLCSTYQVPARTKPLFIPFLLDTHRWLQMFRLPGLLNRVVKSEVLHEQCLMYLYPNFVLSRSRAVVAKHQSYVEIRDIVEEQLLSNRHFGVCSSREVFLEVLSLNKKLRTR